MASYAEAYEVGARLLAGAANRPVAEGCGSKSKCRAGYPPLGTRAVCWIGGDTASDCDGW
jgi:hypothetical protein